MLINLWLLVATVAALDTIPITYTDPPITTTTSSLIVHSLSTYLGPDPFVCIYFTPHSPSLAFAYVQASYNITPSAPTNFTNMSALYFDPDGYSMAKSQLILLHTNPTQANLSVAIFLTAYDSSIPLNYAYDLVVNTSTSAVCPSNCSSRGTCSAIGECSCTAGYYGYDCSVSPDFLEVGKNTLDHDIDYKGYYYVKIPSGSLNSKMSLKASINGGTCTVKLHFKLETVFSDLPSPFSYSKIQVLDDVADTHVSTLNQYNSSMLILLLNYGPDNCHVTLTLNQDTSLGVLMVVIIVVGVAILVALIIGIVFLMRRRRDMARVDPGGGRDRTQTTGKTLRQEDIERFFPVVEASVLGIRQQLKDDTNMDLVPTKDCVVCLCSIEPTDKVRVTYCNHIFHTDCLSGWFAKTQNCPYCRQNFDKDHTKKLYQQVIKSYKRKYSIVGQEKLQGERLAVQVSEHQKSKPLLIQNRRAVDKNDSTLVTFEEDFS